MKITQKQLDNSIEQINQITEAYKKDYSTESERDWRTYEESYALRIKRAAEELEPIAEKAFSMINVTAKRGPKEKIPIPKKVLIILIKDIFQLSNRKMCNLLMLFSMLSGIDISYKTVERMYSDPLVIMTIHNMFMLIVEKKGIKESDATGDGTGYGLTVTKHYRSVREKQLKDKKKKEDKAKANSLDNGKAKKRKAFVYSFGLMDLDTRMYIGYGTSMKSENEAFKRALAIAKSTGINIKSVRLDRLYSYPAITKEFSKETMIYLIPKTNATIKGSPEWKNILKSFIVDPFTHLFEYFKRNMSENGFSVDKNLCGRKVFQKLGERIDTALMCKAVWHNLMLIG